MPRNTSLLLVIWNVVLSALLGWALLRAPGAPDPIEPSSADPVEDTPVQQTGTDRDNEALKDARIAFFYMDSVQAKYELIAEKDERFRSEGQRLEGSLKNEMARAQARYEELMKKDHTYSTQAEVARDEQELQGLMARLQGQQAESEEQLARMEAQMLTEITKELRDYLETYNKAAGFDYIFSVQNGGQIWVGNAGLDISEELIKGLNERYRASKAGKK